MRLISSAFENNEQIPTDYTCDGDSISPPLGIFDVPPQTKSLVLTVDDPDSPNGGFTHWILYNIDPQTEELEEGEVPTEAKQGTNSAGGIGYVGPCPPTGSHHYIFKLSALDIDLSFPAPPTRDELEEAMTDNILAQAELIGLYERGESGEESGLPEETF